MYISSVKMFSNTMPQNTTDTTMAEHNNNTLPPPKYNNNDIIIISGIKKRHIFSEPSWSSKHKEYMYQVDYGLSLTSEGFVLESNILRIANTTGPDELLPL